jgi:hypothetical protein
VVVVDIGSESRLLLILKAPISATTHSHLHYQQQPTLTSNINNSNPLSPPISTTPLTWRFARLYLRVVDIGGERGFLLVLLLEVRVGCCLYCR